LTEVPFHSPVLVKEAGSFLVTDREGVYVDGTVGGGGHAVEVCAQLRGSGKMFGFDLDESALRFASHRLTEFRDRVTLVHGNFTEVRANLERRKIHRITGALLDLGVSSFQLDAPGRGFSFRTDTRIDMRMDLRQSTTGWDVVNTYAERDLSHLIKEFGEERYAHRIARRIVQRRPVESTGQLRLAVESVVGPRYLTKSLARIFQAIRIEVNQELTNLSHALEDLADMMLPGGHMVVISYHSLEDRLVKKFLRKRASPEFDASAGASALRILTKRPVIASDSEVEQNPRARSAKLRAAERREDR